jgi:hypothetical protein
MGIKGPGLFGIGAAIIRFIASCFPGTGIGGITIRGFISGFFGAAMGIAGIAMISDTPECRLNMTHNSDYLPVSGQTFPLNVFGLEWKRRFIRNPGRIAAVYPGTGARRRGNMRRKPVWIAAFPS